MIVYMKQEQQKTIAAERLMLLVLAAIHFTAVVDFLIIMSLGPLYMRVFDINSAQFGLMVSAYGISAGLAGILVHQVRDWFSGAAAYFGWMREAKRENTRCGLRPMSDKAASQKTRSPEGCDEIACALLNICLVRSIKIPVAEAPDVNARPCAR